MDQGGVIPERPDVAARQAAAAWTPPTLDLTVEREADRRVVAAALATGVAADLAVRSGGVGAACALLVVVAAACMLATGRIRNPQAVGLIATAPAFGVWTMFRTSPWLLPLDAVAAVTLLAVGASLARGGSVLDLSPVPIVARGGHGVAHAVAAPGFVGSPLRTAWRGRTRGTHDRHVVRGIALAVPLLVVLAALLGSADPVFGSWLTFPGHPTDVIAHVAVLAAGAWASAGLLRVASARAPSIPEVEPPRLGAVESLVVLAGLDALFAAFVAAQVVAAAGGARHVLATRGLTYADYARSGFFQLVAVAVIALVVLLVMRTVTQIGSRRARAVFLGLTVAAVVLTLGIVGVAVHRMRLYERAFGLTMQRLYVEVAAVAIGAVFVALAVRLAGVGARRAWLTPVGVGLALCTVLALDAIDPEAVVARHDMARAARTGRIDVPYLARLSADAVPALVSMAPDLAPSDRAALRDALCGQAESVGSRGWPAWNLARIRADDALSAFCPAGGA